MPVTTEPFGKVAIELNEAQLVVPVAVLPELVGCGKLTVVPNTELHGVCNVAALANDAPTIASKASFFIPYTSEGEIKTNRSLS